MTHLPELRDSLVRAAERQSAGEIAEPEPTSRRARRRGGGVRSRSLGALGLMAASVTAILIAGVILVLAGHGRSANAPGAGGGSAAPSGAVLAAAQQLLARFTPPAGAVALPADVSHRLGSPGNGLPSAPSVDLHRFWRVRGDVQTVMSQLQAPPGTGTSSGSAEAEAGWSATATASGAASSSASESMSGESSSGAGFSGVAELANGSHTSHVSRRGWTGYAPLRGRTASGSSRVSGSVETWANDTYNLDQANGVDRALQVTAVPLRGGFTEIRVDAQAWQGVIRPAAERIPGDVREILVKVIGPAPAGEHLRRGAAITDPQEIADVVAYFNSLQVPQAYSGPSRVTGPGPTTLACEPSRGMLVVVNFNVPDEAGPTVAQLRPSCGTVQLTVEGRAQPALSMVPQIVTRGGNPRTFLRALNMLAGVS